MKPKKGTVFFVGAGPGDPGLLTLRGASLLSKSSVVIYDGLVNPQLLDLASSAKKIYVGKIKELPRSVWTGTEQLDQKACAHLKTWMGVEEISCLMVQYAATGKTVVRLKGGDPLVFGRGSEEASYLKKSGIKYEFVPGVSAGYSVPAYAGIPVTDRRFSSLVTFVTAHEDPKKKRSSVDWKRLAETGGTIVSFMGIQSLPSMVQGLIQGGESPDTLISIIQWGTIRRQQVLEGCLADIVRKVQKKKISSPAVAVIGEVNRLRKELAWFEKKSSKRDFKKMLARFCSTLNDSHGKTNIAYPPR